MKLPSYNGFVPAHFRFGVKTGPNALFGPIKLKMELTAEDAPGRAIVKSAALRKSRLLAKLQFLGDRRIAAHIGAVQVIQQAAALPYHHQQSPARAVVLDVLLQMFRQMVDALRQQRDLHIRRTRVLGVRLKLFNRLCLRFHNV